MKVEKLIERLQAAARNAPGCDVTAHWEDVEEFELDMVVEVDGEEPRVSLALIPVPYGP